MPTEQTITTSTKIMQLATYAQYLLMNRVSSFASLQRRLSIEVNVPLMRAFIDLPEEEQQRIGENYATELLSALSENRSEAFTQQSLNNWQNNSLPYIDKYALAAEDIIKITFIRRQAFLHFLPEFATNTELLLQIIAELDAFLMHHELALSGMVMQLMEERLASHNHFIEQINHTLPGALYIFDLKEFRNIYSNEKMEAVLGYSQQELNALGSQAIDDLTHSDDAPAIVAHLESCRGAKDGEIYSYKYRLRQKDGRYKWIRTFSSIFKRDEEGLPSQLIAVALDVDQEKRTAEQLKHNESIYRHAEELANIGSWHWDVETDTLSWTDQLYKIYGLAPQSETITLERFLSFVHPDDLPAIKASIDAGFPEDLADYTFRIITADGTQKTIRSIAQTMRQASGRLSSVIGTEQDITEWKALIAQLQESERLYKQAQSLSHIGNWRMNLVTREITWSDEMYRIYEMERGKPFTMEEWLATTVHEDDRAGVIENYEQALAAKSPVDYKHRIVLPDGAIKILHRKAEFVFNDAGEAIELVGMTQDITERQAFSQKIQEQEYFIQHIADASPTILYLFDIHKNNFAYINREIFYVLDFTPEEIMAMDQQAVEQLYHPDDRHLLPERPGSNSQFHFPDSMVQYECRMKKKNGDWCWLLVREIVFKKEENGQVLQILGAALDINKRKEMERTLLQNSFQLEQSNASLEEFAYVASHDLKEPLRKISTFGDRLVATQMDKIDDSGKMYLKKVIDASQRMQTMIDDLLSVSMITGNRKFELHSLQAILDDARQAVEFKLEQKGAMIKADPLPEATIVASQFRQLFQNLLSNSLKFVREGVQPVITITHSYPTAADLAPLNLAKSGAYLKLEFKDNGIGFENEFAGKIFQIFHRLHGRSEYEGTGIGLAICKKIVEHHGGVIYATGVPNEGATFTILLPQ